MILLNTGSHNHRFHRFIKTQIPQININADFPKDMGKQTFGNDTGAFTDAVPSPFGFAQGKLRRGIY